MDLYTTTEAAKYLDAGLSTVRHYVLKGFLPAFKKGKTWLINESDLIAFKESDWLKNRTVGRPATYRPPDMPRLHYFVSKSRLEKIKQQQVQDGNG